MKLTELQDRAEQLKREAREFADQNCPNEASKLMISLEEFRDSWVLSIARRTLDGRRKRREGVLVTLDRKIVKAGDAVDLYFYAQENGVEAAMIWQLGGRQ